MNCKENTPNADGLKSFLKIPDHAKITGVRGASWRDESGSHYVDMQTLSRATMDAHTTRWAKVWETVSQIDNSNSPERN
jgi:hypothetical protein